MLCGSRTFFGIPNKPAFLFVSILDYTIQNRGTMSRTFEITDDQDDFIIRLSKRLVDRQELERMLRRLEIEAIRQKSKLSEEQAAELADDIDRSVWEQVKDKYTP